MAERLERKRAGTADLNAPSAAGISHGFRSLEPGQLLHSIGTSRTRNDGLVDIITKPAIRAFLSQLVTNVLKGLFPQLILAKVLWLIVRFHNIVNCFISKKFQDIVNCLSVSDCKRKLIHTVSQQERAIWTINRNFNDGDGQYACVYRAFHTRSFSKRFSGAELG